MAKTQLTKNTTTGNWELTETNQGQHYTNTLLTAGLPVEGDIKIDVTAKSGTAGTPTATKGVVSNNSITVTPSVTNAEGYISGGTKTGIEVTVNASELVSGNKQLTQATSTDVTNYATATVRSATASMPSSLSGISATPSLSGTTLTLTKNITNTATVYTSGWLSSLTGTTSVRLSGTVPTETKTVTPTDQEQLVEPTSGKLLSSVTVEGLYKTVPNTSDIVSSSNVYKIVGKLLLHVTSGSNSASVIIEDDYIRITNATTSGSSSSASATITYQLLETSGTSTPSWTTKTVSASQSGAGAPVCTIKYTGKIIRCYDSASGSTTFASASGSSTTYPYGRFDSSGQYFKTIGFFELYASGGNTTQYRYAKAKYYRKVSADSYGSNTSTTYPHTKGGTATIEYSDDGTTWSSINAYSSQGTTASGWGTGTITLRVFTDAYILFD